MTRTIEASTDLGRAALTFGCVLAALSLGLLVYELVKARKPLRVAMPIALTGVLGIVALLLAVLRPAKVQSDGTPVGPRVVVLVDASRSIDLPGDDATRRETIAKVLKEIDARSKDVREVSLTFGSGPARPIPKGAMKNGAFDVPAAPHSDLLAALDSVARAPDEHPSAIIVISDGRLDRPVEGQGRVALGLDGLEIPVHAVSLTEKIPNDASVRKVSTAGAAVAHQPFSLRVEVGCAGGMTCESVPVVVRELRDREDPDVLAKGFATVRDGVGIVELPITLHRAGPRVIEVAIEAPSGDAIPDNDRRFVTLDVARDRVRVLHVAGRPTYDVRALRMWLKADESVDVVAFFILRTPTDSVGAPPSDLALIPFPVDELFSVHLPSFDAVVLQDFNAELYGLTKHLGSLANYVREGGGLIMVGGPDAFGPGKYAASPLADVLPVALSPELEDPETGVDLAWFTPTLTPSGKVAPVLGPLREIIGETFPDMPGTNVVGAARPGATVLLTHPRLKAGGAPMPVLALGESGTGRTIALTVDGSHRLLFSSFAAAAAGRAHGALWDGLLGWLMRDPRFDSTVVDLPNGCIADAPTDLVLRPLPGTKGQAHVTVMKLGSRKTVFDGRQPLADGDGATTFLLDPLPPGGYAASVEIVEDGGASGPVTRRDFACEKGGDEWADSRPDPARLKAIADATGGKVVRPGDIDSIPLPQATVVSSQRKVEPILPPWAWTLSAAALVGAHWIARRRSGLV